MHGTRVLGETIDEAVGGCVRGVVFFELTIYPS